uniref:Phosphoribosyl pyrophosphate synthase-associated protein 1 n=1 Tax=Ascaris suum TaxID=6253 RepID=F1L0A8_ASCSU
MVDDIIDDAQSFVAAAQVLKNRGAYKIYVIATHGLLSADAPGLLESSPITEVIICFSQDLLNILTDFASVRTMRLFVNLEIKKGAWKNCLEGRCGNEVGRMGSRRDLKRDNEVVMQDLPVISTIDSLHTRCAVGWLNVVGEVRD